MSQLEDDDHWLGRLEGLPRVLHTQASVDSKVPVTDLQRAIFRAFRSLTQADKPVQVSIADRQGYFPGRVSFKVGIGEREVLRS